MTTMVRAAALTNYFEVAQHLGLNPHQQLRQVGLSASLLENPEQRLPTSAVATLLEESAQAANCPNFGLRMAESRQLSDFGAISLLLSHQPSLRNALDTIVQYRHLLNESLALYVDEVGKTVILREEIVTDPPVPIRQGIELAIGVLFRMCSALLGAHWRPLTVNFTHDAPPELQVHRRLFGCKLEFGSEFNGIVCQAADLDKPNPLADPAMAKYAQRFVESLPGATEQSALADVRKAIYLLLPMGRATIEQISQSLGMNVRTLQRRLEDSGVTFSDLINDVRKDLVLRYMENPRYSLSRIADLLGYSVASSFTRWFTSQFGMAPAAWRRERQIKLEE
ncbi:AraC family transcriptional regulator [Metapseudomonas boanensis]|uniref:AraC family transcriptional regulator n=1 Tax=Metapseudomonas boanensis TaxID=2822138 RepID=A0ABS5XP88_9GAMM|nr:AraC family transcriptional regulator [Pseudomonas boanensis]MBT8769518.1 AraC family transcriptional regulator [Pseudomonas boanensis]